MLKNLKHLKSMALVALLIVMLPSCKSDNQLADDLAGYWTYYDAHEGEDVYLMLVKIDKDTNGGMFLETTKSSYMYYDYNEVAHWIPYCTTINGYWKVEDGNLYQNYDIYSFQLNAYKDEIGAYLANEFNEEMYGDMFEKYEKYDDVLKARRKIKVKGYKMSFVDVYNHRIKCSAIASDFMPGLEFLETE